MSSSSELMIIYAVSCVVSLVLSIGLAFIPSRIAGNKGYSRVGFYFFGLAAFVPAIIVACVLKDRNAAPAQPQYGQPYGEQYGQPQYPPQYPPQGQ